MARIRRDSRGAPPLRRSRASATNGTRRTTVRNLALISARAPLLASRNRPKHGRVSGGVTWSQSELAEPEIGCSRAAARRASPAPASATPSPLSRRTTSRTARKSVRTGTCTSSFVRTSSLRCIVWASRTLRSLGAKACRSGSQSATVRRARVAIASPIGRHAPKPCAPHNPSASVQTRSRPQSGTRCARRIADRRRHRLRSCARASFALRISPLLPMACLRTPGSKRSRDMQRRRHRHHHLLHLRKQRLRFPSHVRPRPPRGSRPYPRSLFNPRAPFRRWPSIASR